MYYPLLRGKLFELLALRELSEADKLDNIVPIIEPVQNNISALNKAVEKLNENNHNHIFIYKPNVGDIPKPGVISYKDLYEKVSKGQYHIPGIIFDGNNEQEVEGIISRFNGLNKLATIHYKKSKNMDEIESFIDKEYIYNILHLDRLGPFVSRQYKDYNNIMLRDPFDAESRNADYKNVSYQFLSDDHIFYNDESYIGYSDYLTIGEDYTAKGWAPYAVVIHLSYLEDDNTCWVRHFVSDSNDDQSDVGGKFMEAIEKLYNWFEESEDVYVTSGLKEFLELYKESHYPGLGYLKKLSIKHHIEIINEYFNFD